MLWRSSGPRSSGNTRAAATTRRSESSRPAKMHSCKTPNCQAFAFGGCGRPTRRLPPYGSKRGSENGKGPAVEAPWPRSAPALPRRSRLLLWNHQAPAPAPAQVLMAVLVMVTAPRHAPRRPQASEHGLQAWLQARAEKPEGRISRVVCTLLAPAVRTINF